MSEHKTTLFEVLLAGRPSVDAALDDAARQVAAIARRKPAWPTLNRRESGSSLTRLYDFSDNRNGGAS